MSMSNGLGHTFPFLITGIAIDHANGFISVEWIDPDEQDASTGIIHRHTADLPVDASPEVTERVADLLSAANAIVQALDDIQPGQPARIPGSAPR